MPELDVKPAMNRLGGGVKGVEPEYPREFPSNGDYLPTTTSQQWHYTHQQMLSVPTPTNPYLGHDVPRGYQLNNGRDVTSEEFREPEEGARGRSPSTGAERRRRREEEVNRRRGVQEQHEMAERKPSASEQGGGGEESQPSELSLVGGRLHGHYWRGFLHFCLEWIPS